MVIKRLFLVISFSCVSYLHATSIITCAHGTINDTLNLDHIEPLSCASYADLMQQTDNSTLVARLVCSTYAGKKIHYVDAHQLHEALFPKGIPTPELAPKILFNPINDVPLVDNITYFAVYPDHAAYVGTLTDVYTRTPAGEYIRAFIGAYFAQNQAERAHAQYALAAYHEGFIVPRDVHTALSWYSKALESAHNNHDAVLEHRVWYALGSVYEQCTDIPDYGVHALTYYKKAAEHTADTYAQAAAHAALGHWYNAYNYDARTALAHYERALSCAADPALRTYIQYGIATICYEGGPGVPKDYARAATLFTEVARAQDTAYAVNSALALGELYRLGGYGLKSDARRAHDWYLKVGEQTGFEFLYRKAQFGIAELYRMGGDQLLQDRGKAHALYTQLLGTCTDNDCLKPMLYNGLAALYCFSCNQIPANYTTAQDYYLQAFNQTRDLRSRAVAANGLATLYYHGTPTMVPDMQRALTYYEYLAQQQNDSYLQAHAYQVLGALYWYGNGNIRPQTETAITYLQQAAQQTINE